MSKKQLQGTIISNKMQKTVIVRVERMEEHPKLKRRFRIYKKYKADIGDSEFKVGDRVIIEECQPISKEKRWKVKGLVQPSSF